MTPLRCLRTKVSYACMILCTAAILLQQNAQAQPHNGPKTIQADELGGRPLLHHAGVHLELRRAFSLNDRLANERRPYLVRVENPVKKGVLERLRAFSATDLLYAPHDAYIASIRGDEVHAVWQIEGVSEVFEIPAEVKIEQRLLAEMRRRRGTAQAEADFHRLDSDQDLQTDPGSGTITLLVGTSMLVSPELSSRSAFLKAVQSDLSSCGLSNISTSIASSTKLSCDLRADGEELRKFAQCAADAWWSLWIAEKPQYHALNYYANRVAQSGGLETPILNAGLTGEGEVIGMADTGLDYDSCFFYDPDEQLKTCIGDGAIADCVNLNHRKIVTYRAVENVAQGATDGGSQYFHDHDKDGHGTHVAGTIAGEFESAGGDAAASRENGVAPGAKLAVDDVDDLDQDYFELPGDLAEALFPHSYAMAGARIHSNSWGSSFNGYSTGAMDIDAFVYDHDDMLVLVAAGNDGDAGPQSTVGEPATMKNGLSVGATRNTPEFYGFGDTTERTEDEVVSFSSLGPTKDGRIKPEVYCIGSDVASAASDETGGCPSSAGRSETVELSGTSMATPACAGAAALAREYCRKGFWPSGEAREADALLPSAALLKAMLISSATVHPLRHRRLPRASTPSHELGYGRVDLSSVLKFADSAFELKLVDRHSVDHGAFREYTVTSAGPFRVTLCWTDPPSYPSAESNLVNDLDLVVIRPGGTELRGNDFGGTGARDALNNAEHVTVPGGDDGQHRVRVYGTELRWAPRSQAYALVIAGSFTDDDQESTGEIDGVPSQEGATCSGVVTLTEESGSFSDGSAGSDYSNRLFCEWIVAPPGASLLALTLDEFDTQADADVLEVFQCADADCSQKQLLGRASGPGWQGTEVQVFSGVMLVRFSSDDATTAPGFTLSWSSTFSPAEQCSGTVSSTESTGDISSAIPYANDLSCEWVIVPAEATSVELSFSLFATEADYDFVRIFECEGQGAALAECSNTKLITALSGRLEPPPTVVSSTGGMKVVFTSDSTQVQEGFAASWKEGVATPAPEPDAEQCSGLRVYTDAAGSLNDGSAGEPYQNNLDCQWVIAPAGAVGVSLTFEEFETEADRDVVSFFDCADGAACEEATLLGQLSGTHEPFDVQSGTGAIKVAFSSDATLTAAGFAATWGLVSAPCSGRETLTDASGSFKDGSGVAYSNDLSCEWVIAPAEAVAVELTFTKFHTEEGYDFVRVHECADEACEEPTLLAQLSGKLPGEKVASATGVMKVEFTSDDSVTKAGFTAAWISETADAGAEATCSSTEDTLLTAASGSLEDGSGAAPYSPNLECLWQISPPGATSVELQFEAFETEEGFDFVLVLECLDEDCSATNDIALLTGNQGAVTLRSQASPVLILFVSDDSVTAPGWSVSWTSSTEAPGVQCSGLETLTSASGEVADGSGTALYQNDLECSWIIAPEGGAGVSLELEAVATEEGYDFLRIFECGDASCATETLVLSLSGEYDAFRLSVLGALKIVFTSDDSVPSQGFTATWGLVSAPCSGRETLTDASGSFEDGSGVAYSNDLSCEWVIAPAEAVAVELTFTELDTEEGYDFVFVYACDDGAECLSAALVANFSGSLGSASVEVGSGAVKVVFSSDVAITAGGFAATWTAVLETAGDDLATTAAGDDTTAEIGTTGAGETTAEIATTAAEGTATEIATTAEVVDSDSESTTTAAVDTTPAPTPTVALKVVTTLTGVTAAELRSNLGGFRQSVASLHTGVGEEDVVVDEDSIEDVSRRRRLLQAGAVSVEYEIRGFGDRAAAEAAKAVQEEGAVMLQERLMDAGFVQLEGVENVVTVSDPDVVEAPESSALRAASPGWGAWWGAVGAAAAIAVVNMRSRAE